MIHRSEIKLRKSLYPKGTRVKAVWFRPSQVVDDNISVPYGTKGKVLFVDDTGTIHVSWENGKTLGVLPEDSVEII